MTRIRLTMAQALVRFLDNQYVSLDGQEDKFVNGIFGVFGHGCVTGIGQALEQGGHGLTFYQGHSEQGMAHAAIAYAKQNNRRKIIACTSSIGPGALNMVTAAGTATANRIPLLLLPGDTFACRQPDPVLQQAEFPDSFARTVNDAFQGVCTYFDRINRPEQLMTAALHALRVLTDPAATGAVCLAMPQDVEAESFDYPDYFFQKRVWHLDRRPATVGEITRAADAIEKAARPLLICGGGVRYSEAWSELQAFAEAFRIPIGETQAGKGLIAWDHELNLGGIGVTGGSAANRIAQSADLIIAVGTRLSDFTTCSKWLFQTVANRPVANRTVANREDDVCTDGARVVAINVNRPDALKMDALPVVADAREALKALSAELGKRQYQSGYGDEIAVERKIWHDEIERLYQQELDSGLSQTRALGIINTFMRPQDIAVGSSGSLPGDMQRLWRSGNPGTYHMEYGFSCMGYEICGALGVKLASPDSDVYAFLGDGSYLMLHSELYTAVQEGQKIILCVMDNQGWGCIENLQNSQGTETFGTVFKARNPLTGRLDGADVPIDFAKNGESYGAKGYSVRMADELQAALADAARQTRPCVLDIKVVPGSMTGGYDSWWRVGVAAVSDSERVASAYAQMEANIRLARDY